MPPPIRLLALYGALAVAQPTFGETLTAAEYAGVKVIALDCEVTENSLMIEDPVPVKYL